MEGSTVVTEVVEQRAAPRFGSRAADIAVGAVILVGLVALSLFLRTRAIHVGYWIDEGLSVGIASFPLTEIPGVLRQDGSPPLYYMLLHVWMNWFGTGEEATHALSVLFSLLAIPAALWAGWSLFGRRAGYVAALLAALNPFLTIYAQETRMYSLVMLLSLVATAAFLHAYAFGRRAYIPAFSLSLALLLYTHNWAVFFILGTFVALVIIARDQVERRRRLLVDAAIGYGVALVVWAPWIPTFLEQAQHTGAPWSKRPSPLSLIDAFVVVLAGQGAAVAILLAGAVGLRTLLGRPSPARTAVLATLAITATTLLTAWVGSLISPAWAPRYLGVLVGPTILFVAGAVPRARRIGLAALVLLVAFWVPFNVADRKENADVIGQIYGPIVGKNDVVISTQPEQVPVLAYYLGRDKRYATPLGETPETRVMDWRDVLPKLEAATPPKTLRPMLDAMPVGGRVFLVRPRFRGDGPWSAPWTSEVRTKSHDWKLALQWDPRFERTAVYSPYTDGVRRALVVEIYEKTRAG
jgi:mannosyltransferase